MTHKKHPFEPTRTLLEHILETVESIRQTVDEIRDQLNEQFDHLAELSWRDDAEWNRMN